MPVLGIDIEARFAQFSDALNKLQHDVTKAFGGIDGAAKALKGTLATIGVSLTVGAITAFVKGAIDAADHLNDLSKKTGIAVETLGGLGFAAKQSGLDVDTMADLISKFNRSIAEAAAGKEEKIAIFDKLGISVRDGNKKLKDGSQLLIELSGALEKYADGPNKVAIAYALLGKQGAAALPFLAEGAASILKNIQYFEKYGKINADLAEKADQFNDELDKFRLLSRSLANSIAGELLEPLRGFLDHMVELKEKSVETDATLKVLRTTVQLLAVSVYDLAVGWKKTIEGIVAFQNIRIAIKTGDIDKAVGTAKEYIQSLKDAAKDTKDFQDRVLGQGAFKKSTADLEDEQQGAAGRALARTFRKNRPDAPGIPNKEAIGKANAAAKALADLDAERQKIAVDAEKSAAADRLDILKQFYDQGLVSERDYWQTRGEIQRNAFNIELGGLQKTVAAREAEVERIGRAGKNTKEYYDAQKDLAQAQAQVNALREKFGAQGTKDILENAKATEDYTDKVIELKAQLADLSGNAEEAARIRAEVTNKAFKRQAEQRGDFEGELLAANIDQATQAQAKFNDIRTEGQRITDNLARSEEQVQNTLKTGAISELGALQKTDELRQAAVSRLKEIAAELDKIATDNPAFKKLKDDADAFRQSLDNLAAQSNLLGQKFKTIFEDAFANEFAKVIDGTQKVGDAFKNMVRIIISEIAKIQAKEIAQKITGSDFFSSVLKFFGVSGSTGGAPVTEAFKADFYSGGYALGTDYVPQTGYYKLHQGEAVIPASENAGGTGVTVVQHLNFAMGVRAEVRDEIQAQMPRIAAASANAVRAERNRSADQR